MSAKRAPTTNRPLTGEELLSIFSRKEPSKLQLAETITQLAEENARRREDQRRLRAHILREEKAGSKSVLGWINNAYLAAAHLVLTELGHSYANAATTLIAWRPAIENVLKKNSNAQSFKTKDRIIQLRKNFDAGRATKNEAARSIYRDASKAINRCKSDPDALEKLAVALILSIEL